MVENGRKIAIIGGGIAGLSAAVYALKCGYDVEVFEMGDVAGGLAMSWRRGGYTFETCLHWLVGSRPGEEMHSLWQEVCDIEKLKFVDPEEFVRIETEAGEVLPIYTNVDRLESALLQRAPQDGRAIRNLTHAIRTLGKFKMMDPAGGLSENWRSMLHDAPMLPLVSRLMKTSGREYGARFSDMLIRSFFANGEMGRLSAIALVLSLAWMNTGNAGYCIGGSQALIRAIEDKVAELGGTLRLKTKVAEVLVEDGRAVGVALESGERIAADWVVSAADGHATIFDLLGGKYIDDVLRKQYESAETFASYVQVSLGVAMNLTGMPHLLSRILDTPIAVDPDTRADVAGFRFFHFDPTFAPAGKTAVTCTLSTRNYAYWVDLRHNDLQAYHAEKQRVADAVVDALEKRVPGLRAAIEVTDVATPASVVRYTGNWKAAQEGWMIEPGAGLRMLPNTLPGLDRFVMAGQWVLPGGGLPSGPITARPAIRAICKHDHVPFEAYAKPEPVGV